MCSTAAAAASPFSLSFTPMLFLSAVAAGFLFTRTAFILLCDAIPRINHNEVRVLN